jgi:hypothetical protein
LYREKGSLDQISIGYFEATRGYVIYAAPRWINTYPRGASK